jgi:hypothetical protein
MTTEVVTRRGGLWTNLFRASRRQGTPEDGSIQSTRQHEGTPVVQEPLHLHDHSVSIVLQRRLWVEGRTPLVLQRQGYK